jgi:hypothetical protein
MVLCTTRPYKFIDLNSDTYLSREPKSVPTGDLGSSIQDL